MVIYCSTNLDTYLGSKAVGEPGAVQYQGSASQPELSQSALEGNYLQGFAAGMCMVASL
jgi:hypothetical protein